MDHHFRCSQIRPDVGIRDAASNFWTYLSGIKLTPTAAKDDVSHIEINGPRSYYYTYIAKK